MKNGMKYLWIIVLIMSITFFIACDNNCNDTKTYIVTFTADNGTENTFQAVIEGNKVSEPEDPFKVYSPIGLFLGIPPTAYTFIEWNKPDGSPWNFANDTVSSDIVLTAVWTVQTPIDLTNENGNNIVEKVVSYINSNGGNEYTLVIDDNVFNVAPQILNQDNTTLIITSSDNTERKITLGENGNLFFIGGEVIDNIPHSAKLVIDGHISLEGKNGNTDALVYVRLGGSLELKGNAKIIRNTKLFGFGGGGIFAVGGYAVGENVTITMSGNSEISDNTSISHGGGVSIHGNTVFTLNDNAKITRNSSLESGGGVSIGLGSSSGLAEFIMNGGEISYNTAVNRGGGVANANDTFTVASELVKSGIHNNSAAINPQVESDPNYAIFTVGGITADSY